MDEAFLALLESVRAECGFPLPVSSGYRCRNHPLERKKLYPGPHTEGVAADFPIYGEKAMILIACAIEHSIAGIGIRQFGDIDTRFIHLDIAQATPTRPRPPRGWIWSYPA